MQFIYLFFSVILAASILPAMGSESFVCGAITREDPVNPQLASPPYGIWATTKEARKYSVSDLNTIGHEKKYYSVDFYNVIPYAFSLTLESNTPGNYPSPELSLPNYFDIYERSISNNHFVFYNNKNISQLNFDIQNITNKKTTYLLTIKAYIAGIEEPLIITVPIETK